MEYDWDSAAPASARGAEQQRSGGRAAPPESGWKDGGSYDVVVIDNAVGLTKDGNSHQVAVRFYSMDLNAFFSGYFSTADKAYPYTEEKLIAMGWDPNVNGAFEMLAKDPDYLRRVATAMHGDKVHCSIKLQAEEYEGKRRLKVAWVNPPGGGALFSTPLDAAGITDFERMMRGKLRSGATTHSDKQPLRKPPPARAAPQPGAQAPAAAPAAAAAAAPAAAQADVPPIQQTPEARAGTAIADTKGEGFRDPLSAGPGMRAGAPGPGPVSRGGAQAGRRAPQPAAAPAAAAAPANAVRCEGWVGDAQCKRAARPGERLCGEGDCIPF